MSQLGNVHVNKANLPDLSDPKDIKCNFIRIIITKILHVRVFAGLCMLHQILDTCKSTVRKSTSRFVTCGRSDRIVHRAKLG